MSRKGQRMRGNVFGRGFGVVDVEAAGVCRNSSMPLRSFSMSLLQAGQVFELPGADGGGQGLNVGRPAEVSQTRATVFGPMPGGLRSSSMEGLYLDEQFFAQRESAGALDLLNVRGHAFADAGDAMSFFAWPAISLRAMVDDSTASAAIRWERMRNGVCHADFEQVGGFRERAAIERLSIAKFKANSRGRISRSAHWARTFWGEPRLPRISEVRAATSLLPVS